MRAALIVAPLLFLAGPLAAHAQEAERPDPRCRRVRATAQSQAFLWLSPTVWAEGVHVPNVGDETGTGVVRGGAWQVRAALSVAPIDMARGAMLLDAASTECRQIEALSRARRAIELGDAIGELAGRGAEQSALAAALPGVEASLTRAEARLREGLATEAQLDAYRLEVERLRRRGDQLDAEIQRLRDAGHDEVDPAQLLADLEAYEAATMELERQRSSMRRLAAWTIQVRGGVLPIEPVDWFGQIQIGFNLGGIAQQIAEDDLVSARAEELGTSRDELRGQVERLRERLRRSTEALREDLAHVDRQLEIHLHQRGILESSATSEVEYLVAMTDLQLVQLRTERARLAALIDFRDALAGSGAEDDLGH